MRALASLCLLVAGLAGAQPPRVSLIEFYGARRVSEKHLREALGLREGDTLPPSKGDLEKRLEGVSGVVRAQIRAVCCDGDRTILFVGIEEREARHFDFHPEPSGDAALPQDVADSYRFLITALQNAARTGSSEENLSKGHALSSDPAARAIQERLEYLAGDHLKALRRVLRESSDASQRAAAAYVIGYASDKQAVVDDLQYALRDPEEGVRANAIRSLAAIAELGARDPSLGIRVQPTWFIQMLNSLEWSDRTDAAAALAPLTEARGTFLLDQIRENAVASLADMARWKTLEYALPPFLILGRVAGVPEDEIRKAWASDGREAFLERALKRIAKTPVEERP